MRAYGGVERAQFVILAETGILERGRCRGFGRMPCAAIERETEFSRR